jgi:iron complex transport system substrate-binding protein
LVSLAAPPSRIVALAPHIVENLFSLGAGKRIVGAVQYSDYPTQAMTIPRVGGVGSISLEQIVALQPELIILWGSGTPSGLRSGIERLNYPYFVDEIRSLRDLKTHFLALGALTGTSAEAAKIAAQIESAVSTGEKQTQEKPTAAAPSVLLQLWDQPLQSIGGEHMLSEVIRRCGGRSITENSLGLAPMISMESVLAQDPTLIIVESAEQGAHWQRYPQLQAVKSNNIIVMDPDLLYRPTLRLLEGMRHICQKIAASE